MKYKKSRAFGDLMLTYRKVFWRGHTSICSLGVDFSDKYNIKRELHYTWKCSYSQYLRLKSIGQYGCFWGDKAYEIDV